MAAENGELDSMRCLIEDLDADLVQLAHDGATPLVIAAVFMHHRVVRYLLKHGANSLTLFGEHGTAFYGNAVMVSHLQGALGRETAHLEAKTHCANPSCTNAGLKKCQRCLKVYFCGSSCIRAHKAECTASAAKLKTASRTPATSSTASSSLSSSSSR